MTTTTVAAYQTADRRQVTARKRLERAGSPAVLNSIAVGTGAISIGAVLAAGGHLPDALFGGLCGITVVFMAYFSVLLLADVLIVDRRTDAFSRARNALTADQAETAKVVDEFAAVNWEALPDTLRDEAAAALACAVQAADWLAWYDQHPADDCEADAAEARRTVGHLATVRDSVRTAVEFASADQRRAAERKAYADSIARRPALESGIADMAGRSAELAATATAAFTRR